MDLTRLRVITGSDGSIALAEGTSDDHALPRRWSGASVHLTVQLEHLFRSYGEDGNGPEMAGTFRSINIGARGDEGFSSILGDDSIFLAEPSGVRQISPKRVYLEPLDDFLDGLKVTNRRIASTGKLTTRPTAEEDDFGFGLLMHLPDEGRDWPESFECRIGLPAQVFTDLQEDLLRGHAVELTVHAHAGFHTLASEYETPREMLLVPGEAVGLHVHSVSTSITPG